MKIFVSRSNESWSDVIAALAPCDIQWNCMSLIRTTPIEFRIPERSFDWVFFSSREAVHAFFAMKFQLQHVRFGAIGQATADALRLYNTPHFVGASSDTQEVAETFAKLIGEATVLFPSSDISIKTVQKVLRPDQVIDLVCYHTVLVEQVVPHCDGYIFSSPSNVDAFFKVNTIAPKSLVWAYGRRTAQRLNDNTREQVIVFEELDAISVARAIKQFYNR